MILAGDIGGTSTRLALFDVKGGRLVPRIESDFPSGRYPGLEALLSEFLDRHRSRISAACFGIAGPVREGRVETPNLSWVVDGAQLAHQLDLESVTLLNDLEATAYGVIALDEEDLEVLQEGRAVKEGNRAIIAAGTGLGEAGLFWDGKDYRPRASEGGHVDFAPRDELESELLAHLAGEFDHVSYERVVSGPGLHRLYRFLRDTGRGEEPGWLAERLSREDPSAAIAVAGLERSSDLCIRALDLFASLYGAEAGNLALKFLATGGVYVGGGIAPKILPKLKEPLFLESFRAKGRYRNLLQDVPVRVVLNDRAGLLGAARHAMSAGLVPG
ncbi:MAG TPA: glucokinase [Candidatus Polarisedimenticolia bacterium]|nr:glucokinase [Candidatus Polarisedimenticolia bacterium]